NLALNAARYNYFAAHQAIAVEEAGHLPTVQAFASYQRNQNPSSGLFGIVSLNTSTSQVGVQADLPIFEGGAVVSRTAIARARYQFAVAQFEESYRDSMSEAMKSFIGMQLGV